MSTTLLPRTGDRHQQRPQRAPFPISTSNGNGAQSSIANGNVQTFPPTRDGSLRRIETNGPESGRDFHLEAALENRRRNGLAVNHPQRPQQVSIAQDNPKNEEGGVSEEQFEDSQVEETGGPTWSQGDNAQTKPQRESLVPLGKTTTVSRMTSTRRYMDQLDLDDVDDVEPIEEEDEEEEHRNDRATWHSGWGSEARDSVASLGVRTKGPGGADRQTRASAFSTKTVDSEPGDTFHYSMYGKMNSPVKADFGDNLSQHLPPALSSPFVPSPSIPISPPSSELSPVTTAPIVRIGPPSPTTDFFLHNPHDSAVWKNDLPSSPPASPVSKGRQPILHESPASPPSSSNRIRSQAPSKNFSRPFASSPSPSNASIRDLERTPTASQFPPTAPPPVQQSRPVWPRKDSVDSVSSPNPLDRKSSLGAGSSSMGHSGSSLGGHSMSASWEDRKLHGLRQQEEAKRAINLAREQSQRIRIDREFGDNEVEELRLSRREEENEAYGGEEEEQEETSIHFPSTSQALPESPYLAYTASPPLPSNPSGLVIGTSQPQSLFSEELPRSPPPQLLSHPVSAFSSEPRPAPSPPVMYQPSVSLPLPMPGSPPLRRRPSDSPSLTSFFSSTPHPTHEPINLSASAPPSTTPPTPKQRNVLRKRRPSRGREEDPSSVGLSAASMARSGSALSSHSQVSATSSTVKEESTGPWAKFRSRSRSKSRSRAAAATSTFFDDPPPSPLPPLPSSSDGYDFSSSTTSKPILRHFASSASLQPPATTPSAFPAPSSAAPLSQADFARLQASRPAFLRSKTSTGNIQASSSGTAGNAEWVLKNVSGIKSVQTGFVHSGESASVHVGGGGREEEMERLNEGVEGLGFGSRPGLGVSGAMNRSVSDQGPSTRPLHLQQQQQHDRKGSNGGNSLYSDYSIYSLPPSPLNTSPTTPMHPINVTSDPSERERGGRSARNSTLQKAKETLGNGPAQRGKMMRTPSGNERRPDPVVPDDFLQIGIDHHEAGDLERAAWCFEQSAKKDGGCGAGMLMYGLTLRHGWGCQLNAPQGFRYLQMAAESVVEDLDRVVFGGRTLTESEANTKAAKSELVLALHEIGISYRFGWGVEKNKKMAVSYFTLSADLGDLDAQQDVAFCYANGKGCKKDLKKAAKYYRMAIDQGAEDWGLSWIYKPKYMGT
ncbi:hypothetical protein JCM16303_006336 [Sporobolomyces ruberrimus]